jgi:stress response protein YsnF
MVKEELRITKRRIEQSASQQVMLRREEVIVERLDPAEQQSQPLGKESSHG